MARCWFAALTGHDLPGRAVPHSVHRLRLLIALVVLVLLSRCAPLESLDPWLMGGGRGVTDWRTDHGLAFLRAQADDPCP